jgi:hypothetical protein
LVLIADWSSELELLEHKKHMKQDLKTDAQFLKRVFDTVHDTTKLVRSMQCLSNLRQLDKITESLMQNKGLLFDIKDRLHVLNQLNESEETRMKVTKFSPVEQLEQVQKIIASTIKYKKANWRVLVE